MAREVAPVAPRTAEQVDERSLLRPALADVLAKADRAIDEAAAIEHEAAKEQAASTPPHLRTARTSAGAGTAVGPEVTVLDMRVLGVYTVQAEDASLVKAYDSVPSASPDDPPSEEEEAAAAAAAKAAAAKAAAAAAEEAAAEEARAQAQADAEATIARAELKVAEMVAVRQVLLQLAAAEQEAAEASKLILKLQGGAWLATDFLPAPSEATGETSGTSSSGEALLYGESQLPSRTVKAAPCDVPRCDSPPTVFDHGTAPPLAALNDVVADGAYMAAGVASAVVDGLTDALLLVATGGAVTRGTVTA